MPSGRTVVLVFFLQFQNTLISIHRQSAVETHHRYLICDTGFPYKELFLLFRISVGCPLDLRRIIGYCKRAVHTQIILVHGILPEQRSGIHAQLILDDFLLDSLLQKLYIVHLELLFQIIGDGLLGGITESRQDEIGYQLSDLILILVHPFRAVVHHGSHQAIQSLLEIQLLHFRIQPLPDIRHGQNLPVIGVLCPHALCQHPAVLLKCLL